MKLTGAQILLEALRREGVEQIFGYAGATICPIMDALKDVRDIGYTLVRTEQNAGHMASGYARVTGKAGVCLVTSGPGATNLITGVATAYLDSIPMVAITGQVPSGLLGRDIFQEVDITGSTDAFTKHNYLVKDAAQLPRIIKEAFYLATTGRPGPVLIDIPVDIQQQEVEAEFPDSIEIRGYHPSVRGNDKQLDHVAEAIGLAKQPVIVAGGGVFLSDAAEELRDFAELNGIPVVTTMMGLSLLPTDHPLNMGMIGSHGNHCANKALAKADLLIMIGTRVADRAILAPDEIHRRMPSIHIDVDPAEIGKNLQPELPLVGNAKVILRQLMERDIFLDTGEWLTQLQKLRMEDLNREYPFRESSVTPGRLLRSLGRKLNADAAICVDVGQNQIWTCKNLWLQGGRLLTSGGLGTMGYSLPAAIGVKVAQPERQTIVVCGDGSFQMSMNELAEISRSGMDIKILMIRNGVLGLVNQIQHSKYSGPVGVALDGSPNFEIIASAYGIPSITLENDALLEGALECFLETDGPCLLIANVDSGCTTND